jgi:triose/dihydroxyacetone kinase / FAD-AMP lyase (cyclizing)
VKSSNQDTVDPSLLDSIIRTACKAAIAAEPKLTQWDMIMGDGDCGEAVQGVSESKSCDKNMFNLSVN